MTRGFDMKERTISEEMAREDILSADRLLDEGAITHDEYIEEIKEIDKTYGTHFYTA